MDGVDHPDPDLEVSHNHPLGDLQVRSGLQRVVTECDREDDVGGRCLGKYSVRIRATSRIEKYKWPKKE